MVQAQHKSRFNFNKQEEKSSEDLRSKFESFSKDKNATAKLMKEYLDAVNPTAKALFEALKAFGESQRESTIKVQDLMKQALAILKEELSRDLTKEQRNCIYDLIIEIVHAARNESQENRAFYTTVASIATGFGIAAIGGGIFLIIRGKEKDVFVKGVQMMFRR